MTETDHEKQAYLDDFGCIFVKQVRDWVLGQNEKRLTQLYSRSTGDMAFADELNEEELERLNQYTRYIVDDTCHHLLYLLSNYQMKVIMPPFDDAKEAVDVAQFADEIHGGLHYCYPCQGGWVQKYSFYPNSEHTER